MYRLPLQDPNRPPLPYKPGLVVQITEHSPPPPFGGVYPPSKHLYLPDDLCKNTPPTQQVLMCSPHDGERLSDAAPRSGMLTIMKMMSVGEARGAQIVVCNVEIRGETPYTAVAKIYDPLYYPCYEYGSDVVWSADLDYSREADAYKHLQTTKDLQKPGFAPEYYGSWTFYLNLTRQGEEAYKRPVRLLLVEHIAGTSILDLYSKNSVHPEAVPDASHFDEAYRLDILTEMLEGVLKQLHSGLDQRDFAPRNVMLVPSPLEAVLPLPVRVVLVDYNIAQVLEHTRYGRHSHQKRSLPTNPAEYFRSYPPQEFEQWIPAKWYSDRGPWDEWLLTTFGGKHADRFAPIRNKLEFSSDGFDVADETGGASR
ncbi:hypothetical protein F4680DRAFT_180300 [Xylaria scruposa]|nr:hypothetical protein F4680DRAFT_180300 [Xylaria scruposa]